MLEYEKCLVELDEILKLLSYEDLAKIPYEIRNAINKEKDKNYIWHYDETKRLSEQNMNRKTIAILSYLNMEYLLNEEEKSLMKKLHEFNERKIEKEKQEKYNSENIFRNKDINNKENELMIIENTNDKWYKIMFVFLKKILKKLH